MYKPVILEISDDAYELPLAVANSCMEMARIVGCDPSAVFRGLRNQRQDRKARFIRVWVPWEEDDDG